MEARPLVVIGAGAAGTSAAIEAARAGVQVTLIDENPLPPSMMGLNVPLFFGQRFTEPALLTNKSLSDAEDAGVEVLQGTCVWGAFRNSENSRTLDGPQIGLANHKRSWMIKYDRLIVATGARDLAIGFAGSELPGAMGANGAHSLISRYSGLSSERMIVLGSSNLGLRTAKTARDNGIDVAAVIDVSPSVLGDESLASELQNDGVDFYISHTIKEAVGGDEGIQSVKIVEIDEHYEPLPGTEKHISADTVCFAIGLVPNIELLSLLGCDLTYDPRLGGHIPVHNDQMRTSVENIFVAGDVAGFHDGLILDPGIARRQGRAAGLAAAASLGAIDESDGLASNIEVGTELEKSNQTGTDWQKWLRSLANAGGQDIFACQCEEVTRTEIIGIQPPRYLGWDSEQMSRRTLQTQLEDNAANSNQIKRLTRAGTGICQGRNCREQVAMLLAEESGTDVAEVPFMTYRAPLRPLPLNVMWPDDETEQVRHDWPKWFAPTNQVLG